MLNSSVGRIPSPRNDENEETPCGVPNSGVMVTLPSDDPGSKRLCTNQLLLLLKGLNTRLILFDVESRSRRL
jgi:hypothetical protein